MQFTQVAYGGCWKCPHDWQCCSAGHALLGGFPEGFGPLIRHRNGPRDLGPIARRHGLFPPESHDLQVYHGSAFRTHFFAWRGCGLGSTQAGQTLSAWQ